MLVWYHNAELLNKELAKHGSLRKAAIANKVHHTTLSTWFRKLNCDQSNLTKQTKRNDKLKAKPGATITGDTATIIGAVGECDPEKLLVSFKMNPNEWDYSPTVNVWETIVDGELVVLSQLKLVCKRRVESLIHPADRPSGWKPKPPRVKTQIGIQHVMLLPDPHCPHDEPVLTAAAFQLANLLQPEKIVCLGDTSDNSPWKRHKPNPRTDVSAQVALDSTYEWFANLRASAPDANIVVLPGNHDWWLYDRIKETLPALVTLTRPGDDFPVLSMRHLLRFDELHIELIDTIGEYHDATHKIVSDLVGLHGTRTGKHGGAAREFDNWENASIVQGHDHKLAVVAITKRLPDGTEQQRYAISAGTMARRDLGYDHARNVNQGFPIVTVYDDGRWHWDFALFDPQRNDVTWRDFRFSIDS